MTGDPKSDKFEDRDVGARGQAASDADTDLADQVERVVSLLHKLETLYAQTPPRPDGLSAPASRYDDDRGRPDLDEDFLERFSAIHNNTPPRAITDQYARGGAGQQRAQDYGQPPPIPGRAAAGANADPGSSYKGALRQHEAEVKAKPNLLTKVGFAVAAILAIVLTLPWLVPAALGPEWRQSLAGNAPPAALPAAPTKVAAAPKAPAPPPKLVQVESPAAPKARPEAPKLPPPPASPPEVDTGEGDFSGAAPAETAMIETPDPVEAPPAPKPATASPPARPAPPVFEETSKEEAWRAAALQAILDQRTAWRNAKTSGDWSGIAQASPVDSRTFGEFDPPSSAAAAAPPGDDGGSRMAALETGQGDAGSATQVADTCESALVEGDQRSVRLSLADPDRTGTHTELVVNDISYRAMFGADGRLSLEAPRLDESPVLRWVQRDGSVCQRNVPRPEGPPSLQVAVMWSGDLGLELDVVEPHSWPGSPTGYITSLQPNLEGAHGAGAIRAFGRQGDPNRALVYSVATADIGASGVLNVQVKLSPRAEGGGTCGASAEVFTNAEVLYEVYIVRDDGAAGKFRRENKAYAFKVPPCGATAAYQRIERLSVRF